MEKKQNLNRLFVCKEGKGSDYGQTPELPVLEYGTEKLGLSQYVPVEVCNNRVHWAKVSDAQFDAESVSVPVGTSMLSTEIVKPVGAMQSPLVLRGKGDTRIWSGLDAKGQEIFTVEAGSLAEALTLAEAKKARGWANVVKVHSAPKIAVFGLTARN